MTAVICWHDARVYTGAGLSIGVQRLMVTVVMSTHDIAICNY